MDDAKARRGSESSAHVAVSGSKSASRGVASAGRGGATRRGRDERREGEPGPERSERPHEGPHRTRHARALPGGPAHVGFGRPRVLSAGLARPRLGPVVEATQIAHARTLPGWHSPAGRQAERKVLLSVPPWAVQPVSIVPSAHYVSHSPRLSRHPPHVQVPLSDPLFFLTFLFSQPVRAASPPSARPPPPVSTGITGF